jgi:hypothetical protein
VVLCGGGRTGGLILCRCFAGSEMKKWQIVSTPGEGAFLDWLDRELAIELSCGGVPWASWAWRWSANCIVSGELTLFTKNSVLRASGNEAGKVLCGYETDWLLQRCCCLAWRYRAQLNRVAKIARLRSL